MAARRVSASSLQEQANDFAASISRVVSAFTGVEHPFVATALEDRVTVRYAPARQAGGAGIPLKVEGDLLLTLNVTFDCTWDSKQHYLAVEKSDVAVYPLARITKEPLFRYEFARSMTPGVPCSHLQVHAHRDSFTHLLGHAGERSRRAKRRVRRDLEQIPAVSEFHFPLGGPRFRPALEDILEVLHEEFGLDIGASWSVVRDEARAEWRRRQVGTAVRDAPEEAVRVLRELGYHVSGPPVPERIDKLTML